MQIVEYSYFPFGDVALVVLPVYEEALFIVRVLWLLFCNGRLVVAFAADSDVRVEDVLSHHCSCPASGYPSVKQMSHHCFVVSNLCIYALVVLEKACNNASCHAWWVT